MRVGSSLFSSFCSNICVRRRRRGKGMEMLHLNPTEDVVIISSTPFLSSPLLSSFLLSFRVTRYSLIIVVGDWLFDGGYSCDYQQPYYSIAATS